MLLTRQEMRFNFRGARLRLPADRETLGWIFSQFLYGEVTGIQCGYWLHRAPDLDAARFLARQATEEMQHVSQFVDLIARLGVRPSPAHRLVRLLSTGLMGERWDEHVALEMALGEGFVLTVLYALADTLPDPAMVEVLERAIRQEERHVAFGEERALQLVRARPAIARRLRGQALISLWLVQRLGEQLHRHTRSPGHGAHPVLGQLGPFVRHAVAVARLRLERLGLGETRATSSVAPPGRTGATGWADAATVAYAAAAKLAELTTRPVRSLWPVERLTERYLEDPVVALGSGATAKNALRMSPPSGVPSDSG
jgi:hypothetical protein